MKHVKLTLGIREAEILLSAALEMVDDVEWLESIKEKVRGPERHHRAIDKLKHAIYRWEQEQPE